MILSDSNIDTKITLETDSNPIDEELPFHVLLLGDWSGRENHPQSSNPIDLHPIEIDRDNFDDVMRKLGARLNLDFHGNGESSLTIEFTELDDFHPDKIFEKLPLFANLRDTRQRLINKDTFDDAAREINSWLIDDKSPEANKVEAPINSIEARQQSPLNLLEQILGETQKNTSASQKPDSETSELNTLIEKLVKPHLIQTDRVEQSKLLAVIDEVISDLMRKILHHPHFQALESAWRGIHLLVRRVETNALLKFFLLDISKSEISNNLKSVSDLDDSDFYRLLVEFPEPWSIICGNYTFEVATDDIATLIRLAKLGNVAVAPFISHIKPQMFGFNSFVNTSASDKWLINEDSNKSKLWNTLRTFPEVNYLGLAAPRFFIRLPYGENTEPAESFNFEEFTFPINSEQYLWANPSFVCTLLLAQSFQQSGWNMQLNLLQNLDNLPIHLYSYENEIKTKHSTEIVLTDNKLESLLEQGLIPLITSRNSDKLRLARFQSIAFPFSTLKGKWN